MAGTGVDTKEIISNKTILNQSLGQTVTKELRWTEGQGPRPGCMCAQEGSPKPGRPLCQEVASQQVNPEGLVAISQEESGHPTST